MTAELKKVIQRLEHERKSLLRTPFVLSRKRDNVVNYLEILALPRPRNNRPKSRAQQALRHLKECSIDLFVLCALSTNQRALGTVKWTREEINAVLQWWAQAEKPLASLQIIRRSIKGMS